MVDKDDEKIDSTCPIFDYIYNNGGPAVILSMANFSPYEFCTLYNEISEGVNTTYNVGRDRNASVSGKDAFLCQ